MRNSGFTLIEVVVVMGIIGLLTTFLIANFSRTQLNLNQAAASMVADIRDIQTKAVTSTRYNGSSVCGYGISFIDATTFRIYTTTPSAANGNCSLNTVVHNRNYEAGDVNVRTVTLVDPIQFTGAFADFFFEPPDPKTYIGNSSSLAAAPSRIRLRKAGGDCIGDPNSCYVICVHTSGRIDTAEGIICP
jgi:prepilin-type N-terminal cleavage/methylation domain-containing protein